ncbi:MAG: ATP-binding protein [Candidatus Pacearchaeota archaeon]|nr:ATP-binding protein [Candidatus Pacearchaeota archaeon]
MLVEFNVTNFKSIRSKQTFSMTKAKGDELEESNSFQSEGATPLNLLRSAAIYGPNASGKSNFIEAMSAMKRIVEDSATELRRGDKLPVDPFRLDPEMRESATEFEVVFISKGTRYQYGFAATQERIVEEWMIAFPKGRAQNWFSRFWIGKENEYDWEMGSSLSGKKQLWREATRSNALFLSTAVQLNSEQLQPVYDWFSDTLRTTTVTAWSPGFTAGLCCKDSENKKRVLNLLKAADLDIKDISVKKKLFDESDLSDDLPKEAKSRILERMKGKEIIDELYMLHEDSEGNLIAFDFEEESDGTQKLFSFAGPWLDVLKNGYVLFVDELHDNLHPKIVQFLVDLFHSSETNTSNAQLVFTTHETTILNQNIFRRDQIWFCEKGKDHATTVYPLTDFSPRKVRENLELSYLAGRYGAVPYIRMMESA